MAERIVIQIDETGGDAVDATFRSIIQSVTILNNTTNVFNRTLAQTATRGRGLRLIPGTFNAINSAVVKTSRSISGLFRRLTSLRSAFAVVVAGAAVGSIVRLSDAYQQIENRIAAFIPQAEKAAAVQERLFDISIRTRSSFVGTANLFARLVINQDSVGESTERLLLFTEAVNKAIQISGSTTQEAEGALRQLSQLVSNRQIRAAGQELAAIREQAPALFKAILDGLNLSERRFRELAEAGLLTSSGVISGVLNEFDNLDEQFSRIVPTVGSLFEALNSGVIRLVGSLSQASTVFRGARQLLADIVITTADAARIVDRGEGLQINERVVPDGTRLLGSQTVNAFRNERTLGPLQEGGKSVAESFVETIIARIRSSLIPAAESAILALANYAGSVILDVSGPVIVALFRGILNEASNIIGKIGDLLEDNITTRFLGKVANATAGALNLASFSAGGAISQSLGSASQNLRGAAVEEFGVAARQAGRFIKGIKDDAEEIAGLIPPINSAIDDANAKLEESQAATAVIRDDLLSAADTVGLAFGNALENIIFRVDSLRDALRNLAEESARILFREVVGQTVSRGVSSFLGPALTSAFGAAPAAGGAGVDFSAAGNVILGGAVVPFARGGIAGMINDTTIFPLRGGRIGVAGEAGPEVAMPARMADGNLGVRVSRPSVNVVQNINIRQTGSDRFGLSPRLAARELRSGLGSAAGG